MKNEKTERLHFVRNKVVRGVLCCAGTECDVPAEEVRHLLERGYATRLVPKRITGTVEINPKD